MNLQGRIWYYLNKKYLFRVKIQLVGQIGTVPAGLGLIPDKSGLAQPVYLAVPDNYLVLANQKIANMS